jgi:DNA replication protein DnaC
MSRDANADHVLQGEIERLTRRLRLPYVRAAAPELLKTARSQRWDPAEALRMLLEEEVAGRDQSGRETRRQSAAFPHQKTFHTWIETASSIPVHVQHALRALEWIERRENLILCGASGTGKSHFLEALGQAAIDRDLRVVWFTLEDLGSLMRRHRIDDTNARAIKRINRADLVCVDDIGLLPTSPDAAEGFFRVIDAAYERRSLAISSNLHPSNFDTIMPKTLAAAAVDRLLHHAHVLQIDSDSFRLKEATAGKGVIHLNN